MRVRTAVGIAAAFVTVKAGLTGVVLTAWGAIPHRRWPVNNWHFQLGNLAEAFAAVGTVFAAGAALWIATRDRRERERNALQPIRPRPSLCKYASPSVGASSLPLR